MISDSIKLPNIFWHAVDKLGISRSALIKEANLPLTTTHEEAKMKTLDFFSLWNALAKIGGFDIGFKLACSIESSQMPPSFLVAYYAKDLRDAINRVVRFKHLCTPENLQIDETNQLFNITIKWPLENVNIPDALIDATIYSLLRLAREGTGQNIQPAKIKLTRPVTTKSEFLKDLNVEYSYTENSISFHQQDMSIFFTRYNQELLQILDQAIQSKLEGLTANTSVSDQVKWLLRKSLTAGRPELRSVARELAISERSLQRYLKNEGESFQSLLTKTRHEMAFEYLADPRLDLAEIAYMLGYEEQASFFRAFQEWENTTPTKWREVNSKNRK